MRIYSRQEFLSLPCPVLYMKWEQNNPSFELKVKHDNLGNDWCYVGVGDTYSMEGKHLYLDDIFNESITNFDLDLECGSRDGCFDDKEMFIVFEKQDIEKIKHLLNTLYGAAKLLKQGAL